MSPASQLDGGRNAALAADGADGAGCVEVGALGDDDPQRGKPFVEAAQRLKPRELATLQVVRGQYIVSVRHATRNRRFDAARQAAEAMLAVPVPALPRHYGAGWSMGIRPTGGI